MPRLPLFIPEAITGAPLLAASIGLAAAAGLSGGSGVAQTACRALMPIGGGGSPVVEKRISADRVGLLGRTNWNTDFAVDRSFASYRINFQSASTGRGTFPVAVFLRFTDGSNLQVVNENLTLAPGQRRVFGPFPAVPGKRTNQVNVRVGASSMPGSTGFSYRVSVDGCN
ncbi:MAG: hypothetical protein VKI81_00840 [Synechococcaceae cyanobacterium]|nr:hypothetical protein [Synechococcaceae cyanobacterium]